MNYVEIKGGLGNQIFQYVFSKYIREQTGECCVLHVDFYEYVKKIPGATVRQFDLDKFNTEYITVRGAVRCNRMIEEEYIKDYDRDVLPGEDETVFYRGYWQDKCFWTFVRERIIREFTLKEEYISEKMNEYAERMKRSESVAIHIRGTDYLQGQNKEIFAIQDAAYYKKALDIIQKACSKPLRIFVFTDDLIRAEAILRDIGKVEYELMPRSEAYQDLWLMSQTKHHIIANSSYSYWGAVLGKREKGITVAPAQWFLQKEDPKLYPDSWIVV